MEAIQLEVDTGDDTGCTGKCSGNTGHKGEDTDDTGNNRGVEEEPIRLDFPIVPSITAHCDQQKPLCPSSSFLPFVS